MAACDTAGYLTRLSEMIKVILHITVLSSGSGCGDGQRKGVARKSEVTRTHR